jgi:hypothetical protein
LLTLSLAILTCRYEEVEIKSGWLFKKVLSKETYYSVKRDLLQYYYYPSLLDIFFSFGDTAVSVRRR